jgi:hypothetical protein
MHARRWLHSAQARWAVARIEIARFDRSCHISNENSKNLTGIVQGCVSVDFQVGLATVANQYEFSVGKISHEFVQGRFLPFSNRLENALEHARVLFQME